MSKHLTDLNNTVTEIINTTGRSSETQARKERHIFSCGLKELESWCGREVHEGYSRWHEQHREEFCTSSADMILERQRRGLQRLSQEAGTSSREEIGAGSQQEGCEDWAAPWSQAGLCSTCPVSVLRGYCWSHREQCQNKTWPRLSCLQMRNKCIGTSCCLVSLNSLMHNNVRI